MQVSLFLGVSYNSIFEVYMFLQVINLKSKEAQIILLWVSPLDIGILHIHNSILHTYDSHSSESIPDNIDNVVTLAV